MFRIFFVHQACIFHELAVCVRSQTDVSPPSLRLLMSCVGVSVCAVVILQSLLRIPTPAIQAQLCITHFQLFDLRSQQDSLLSDFLCCFLYCYTIYSSVWGMKHPVEKIKVQFTGDTVFLSHNLEPCSCRGNAGGILCSMGVCSDYGIIKFSNKA